VVKEILQGIRVLDFSRYKAGPTCGQILGDIGAEVIRVEKPGGEEDRRLGPFAPDGQSLYLMFTCRNKKAITLNLQKQKGEEILKELVKQSDVVIENFGPGANQKLGLDYESLKNIKSDIITVAVSAYGQYGPYASQGGFDAIAQAMSGMMWLTGFSQGLPVREGVSIVDTVTGFYGAMGTLFALYHREKTGEGQLVDVSLLDSAVSFMESTIAEKFQAMVKLGLLNSSQWRAFVRKTSLDSAPPSFAEAISAITAFLGPVVAALAIEEDFQS